MLKSNALQILAESDALQGGDLKRFYERATRTRAVQRIGQILSRMILKEGFSSSICGCLWDASRRNYSG